MECVFGLVGKGFALVVADTSAVHSLLVHKCDEDKVMILDSHELMGASGEAGDRFWNCTRGEPKHLPCANGNVDDSSQPTKAITYGTKGDLKEDDSFLCGKLVPVLERLELLTEEKTGHNLKVFHRLASSLKETSIQKLGT